MSLGTKDLRHPSPRVVTMCDGGHSANAHDYGAASTLRNTWPDICNLFQGYVSLDRQGHISFNNARKVNYSVQPSGQSVCKCHSSPIKFISRFATNSRYVHFESIFNQSQTDWRTTSWQSSGPQLHRFAVRIGSITPSRIGVALDK